MFSVEIMPSFSWRGSALLLQLQIFLKNSDKLRSKSIMTQYVNQQFLKCISKTAVLLNVIKSLMMVLCVKIRFSCFLILKVLKPWQCVSEVQKEKLWSFSLHERNQCNFSDFFFFNCLWFVVGKYFLSLAMWKKAAERIVWDWKQRVSEQQPAAEMLASGKMQLPHKINSLFTWPKITSGNYIPYVNSVGVHTNT